MNHHRQHATKTTRPERWRGYILAAAIGAALGLLLAIYLSK